MSIERSHEDRKHDVLSAIVNYTNWHHYPPTYREIGEIAEVPSTSHVGGILTELEKDGCIVREDGSRAIRVTLYPSPIQFEDRFQEVSSTIPPAAEEQ